MLWTLPACVLLVLVKLSDQDLVTLAPSELGLDPSEHVDTDAETPKSKPTIRSLHIISDVKYRYATTRVSSRVVNVAENASEAVFFVTLPDSAFISEFLMEVKGKVYKAYVKEKEEAKAEYDQAVQAGQFAGHVALDARDSNQFTVSVNVEAQGKVTFNLTYEQLLSRNLGVYSNVININPQQIVEDMSVIVNIEEPTTITHLEVPEVQISNEAIPDKTKPNTLAKIEDKSPKQKQVVWAPTPEEQKSQNSTGVSGQFIVRYDVDREENPQQILVDEGYFVHFFAPENLPKLKKHVVFVLDLSGSMNGRKIEQLKDAMDKILTDLEAKDFFSIVTFESQVSVWSPDQIQTISVFLPSNEDPASDLTIKPLNRQFVVKASPANIALARSYVANFTDLGGTNIMGGLRAGLQLAEIGSDLWINESDPPQPVVVFLTDGQPNVEEYDTNTIINKTKALNTKESPIFSLAFGYGADFNFLRKLSLSNYGFARNIYEAADASDQLKNFYQTIASPLLTNVTFSYLPGQVDNSSNTKAEFPVFFKGSELVVAGKINKDNVKDKMVIGQLSGISANGSHDYPIVIDFIVPPREPENRTIGHLEKTWAYLTIQQLLDKADSLDNAEERNNTNDKALKLALKYSFVTPLTSLVVVKPNETESSVGTTQVKPGLDGPSFSSSSAAFGGGLAGYPGVSSFGPMKLAVLSPNRQYTMHSNPYGFQPLSVSSFPAPMSPSYNNHNLVRPSVSSQPDQIYSSTPHQQPLAMQESAILVPKKGTLNDIKWLQPYLASGNTTAIMVEGRLYKLGLNESDQSFGDCQVESQPGECHHFKYCALTIFQDNISAFTPYQCQITGDYLGVCCPTNAF